jgi:hypothetical protein
MRHAALAPILALLALVLAIPTAAHGQAGSDTKVSVTAVAPRPAVRPGDRIPVAVILDIAPEWHVWTSEAQAKALPAGMVAFDAAIFTEITLQGVSPASAASAPGGIQWPKPHGVTLDQGDGPQAFAVYEGKAIAYVPVVVSDSASGRVELAFDVTVQACTDTPLILGNVATGTWDEVLGDPAIDLFHGLTWGDVHGCRDCDLLGACARCHASALHEAGDYLGPYAGACARARARYAAGAGGVEIEVVCSDPAEHRRRVEHREVEVPGLVPPTWAEVTGREWDAWTRPRLVVDTFGRDTASCVAEVLARLE